MHCPDAHRQPREWSSAEQAHDDEIPGIGSAHGICVLHEKDEHPSGCRVGAERRTRRRTDSRTGITEPLTRLFVFQSVQTVSAGLSFRKRLQRDRERRVDSRS